MLKIYPGGDDGLVAHAILAGAHLGDLADGDAFGEYARQAGGDDGVARHQIGVERQIAHLQLRFFIAGTGQAGQYAVVARALHDAVHAAGRIDDGHHAAEARAHVHHAAHQSVTVDHGHVHRNALRQSGVDDKYVEPVSRRPADDAGCDGLKPERRGIKIEQSA